MKRLLSFFLIITIVASTYLDAEASPAVAVVAVAAGASLLVAAGATSYYQNSSGASAAVSAAGQVYSDVTAYTKGITAVGQAVLYSQAASLAISAQQLLDAVSSSASSLYSALKGLLSSPTGDTPLPSTIPPNSVVTATDGSNYRLGPLSYTGNVGPASEPLDSRYYVLGAFVPSINGKVTYTYSSNGYVYAAFYEASSTADPRTYIPPPVGGYVPVSSVPQALTGTPSGSGPIAPDVAKDINDLIKANPSIAKPVTSGSATASVGGSTSVDVPYTPDLPAGSTVASTPSTTVPTQIPTQDEAVDPPDVYPSTNAVELKKIDLSKWTKLYGVMEKTFPFSLLTTLSGYLDVLVVDPVAPSFDMHIYQEQKLHIDLSFFDPVAALVRWVIGILLTIGAILGMQKWWRGVS